jgi:hypothetical protein
MKQFSGRSRIGAIANLGAVVCTMLAVVTLTATNVAAQAAPCTQPDHLKCYRVGLDPFINTDLLSLDSPQFGVEPGCQVDGHAIQFCVPVCKTVVTSPPPTGTGFQATTILTDDELCYAIKCTTNNAPKKVGVEDQFSARTIPLGVADLICAPAEKLPPLPCGFVPGAAETTGQCGGACPADEACKFTPQKKTSTGVTPPTCLCADTTAQCGNTAPPTVAPICGGACPPITNTAGAEQDQLCRDLGGNCTCTPF